MPSPLRGVRTGLDRFQKAFPVALEGARAGLLVHPASVNGALEHSSAVLHRSKKIRLAALFGPQHGLFGQTQDNMVEWEGFTDPATGLPAHSLYGEVRMPKQEWLRDLDLLIVDLQDVGSRYYTFIWTMALCMEACAEAGMKILVLDRPNPIGGRIIEGYVLDLAYTSFVGLYPLPVRHGMTPGELAMYLRAFFIPTADVDVIRMKGWKRSSWFEATGLPWVMPSPNMPSPDTAMVYPGMCLLEATNLSEGRGTTRPFEIFGAPFMDAGKLVKRLVEFRLPGVIFRPLTFQPTFQKWAGLLCQGAQIHVMDRKIFKPFLTGVTVLKAVFELYPGHFQWKQPPYEYEYEKMPIDILAGNSLLRLRLEEGVSLGHMEEEWLAQLPSFEKIRKEFLLY
jgi:uncharacterized protein YbbC (DUF1343 family)